MLLVSTPVHLNPQQRQHELPAAYRLDSCYPNYFCKQFTNPSAIMSNPSPQPSEEKQTDKNDCNDRAATLKHQLKNKLMQRRLQPPSVQPEDMSSSKDATGQSQQQKQPMSDRVGPIQTKTATAAQAQPIPGLSYQVPEDKCARKGASQSKQPSVAITADQLNTNESIQSSGDITGRLMEMLSSQMPSKAADKDSSDALVGANEVGRDVNALSDANGHAAAKVEEEIDNDDRSKIQRGDDSTANKETDASCNSTKSTAVAKKKPNAQSSTEEGKITGKPSAPLHRIPVKELTRQPASHKKTPPSRVSTVNSIVPTEPHAKRHMSRSLEVTPAPRHTSRGCQDDAVSGAQSSASRSNGKQGQGLASLPARPGRLDHSHHMTRENHKEPPPPARHAYARSSREQRPHSSSPMASWPVGLSDWEVQRFACRDPDLRDWLHLTGWYHTEYRKHELDRLRRREEIEHESAELRKEGELEKARLKDECREPYSEARYLSDAGPRPLLPPPASPRPRRVDDVESAGYRMLGRYTVTAGTKRERSEESDDDDADGGSSAKYYRTNRNYRGSRAGHLGSHHSHHRGREVSRHWQDQGSMTCFPSTSLSCPQNSHSNPPPPRLLQASHPSQRCLVS